MAIYRNFYTQFWDDDFILDLSKDERYLYFYLITNPKTTLCGIYELPYKVIEFHTSLVKLQIDKLLESLEKKEKIVYDKKTNEVCIRNWLKYNVTKSPKLVVSLEKSFKDVKNQNLIQYLNDLDTVSIQYQYPIDTVCIPSVTDTVSIKESFNSLNVLKKEDTIKESKEKNLNIFSDYANGNDELLTTLNDFESMRNKIKRPLTDRAKKMLLSQLDEFKEKGHNIIEILEQSIFFTYQGVFEVKPEFRKIKQKEKPVEEQRTGTYF